MDTRYNLLVLMLPLILATTSCNRAPEESDKTSGEIINRDTLKFPDTETGRTLSDHLNIMFTVGPDAESNYQASLTKLRANESKAVTLIVEAYNKTDKSLYTTRASLVEILTELKGMAARDPLILISSEFLPKRVTLPDDVMSPFRKEVIIRMTAIRGVGHLAGRDDTAARFLGKFARHKDPTIQEEAKRALALAISQLKDKERIAFLVKLFPGNYLEWLPPEDPQPVPPLNANPDLVPSGGSSGSSPTK